LRFCPGIFEEGRYEDRETILCAGDRPFAYTDGISEASPDDRALFGALLPDLLRRHAGAGNEQFLGWVDESLAGFLGNSPPLDDYTLLSIEFLGGAR